MILSSLYKLMHEFGHPDAASKKLPFPSAPESCTTVSDDGGQDKVARFSMGFCLRSDRARTGELYNIVDEPTPRSMAERWPIVCKRLGLEGMPPMGPGSPKYRTHVKFAKAYPDHVKKLEQEKTVQLQGLRLGEPLERWMEHFDFDLYPVLDNGRSSGFMNEMSFKETWKIVFGRLAEARMGYLR